MYDSSQLNESEELTQTNDDQLIFSWAGYIDQLFFCERVSDQLFFRDLGTLTSSFHMSGFSDQLFFYERVSDQLFFCELGYLILNFMLPLGLW